MCSSVSGSSFDSPAALVAEVAAEAAAQEREDAWVADRIAEGDPIDGLFPPNEAWQARYRAEP